MADQPFDFSFYQVPAGIADLECVGESRWLRDYVGNNGRLLRRVSRLLDGSVSVSLQGIQHDWNTWPQKEQIDFCQAFADVILSGAPFNDSGAILRFVIDNACPYGRTKIALAVALARPSEEAFSTLSAWCDSAAPPYAACFLLPIVLTEHPGVELALQNCLARIWRSDDLMQIGDYINATAIAAASCIHELIRVGVDRQSLASKCDTLLNHPCEQTRKFVKTILARDVGLEP